LPEYDIESAYLAICEFISDMDYCKFGDEDDNMPELAAFAAEWLQDEIISCPELNPIEVTISFLQRMEDYAIKGKDCDWIFKIYADAIREIYMYYL